MINWKLRLKNKVTLLTLLLALIAFVYQVFGIFGIVIPVSQSTLTQLIALLINILAALGIVVDPTTTGVSDSDRAMGYDEPR